MWRRRTPPALEQTAAPTERLVTVRLEETTIQVALHPLSSSLLEAAGHDGSELLVIVYRSRDTAGNNMAQVVRVYKGVKPPVFESFLTAPSPGTFFQQFIWDRYPSQPATLGG